MFFWSTNSHTSAAKSITHIHSLDESVWCLTRVVSCPPFQNLPSYQLVQTPSTATIPNRQARHDLRNGSTVNLSFNLPRSLVKEQFFLTLSLVSCGQKEHKKTSTFNALALRVRLRLRNIQKLSLRAAPCLGWRCASAASLEAPST